MALSTQTVLLDALVAQNNCGCVGTSPANTWPQAVAVADATKYITLNVSSSWITYDLAAPASDVGNVRSVTVYAVTAFSGVGPANLTVDLIIGGVSKGTVTLATGAYGGGDYNRTFHLAAWDGPWKKAQVDGAQVKLTTNTPGATAVVVDQMYVEWTYDLGTVETPTISPDGGRITPGVDITLACSTSGSTIYYTTPDSGSTEYSAAFNLTSPGTVEAIGTKTDWENSAVASSLFRFSGVTNLLLMSG